MASAPERENKDFRLREGKQRKRSFLRDVLMRESEILDGGINKGGQKDVYEISSGLTTIKIG